MKIDIDKLGDIFTSCKLGEAKDFYKEVEYVQISSRLFVEKYLENSSCTEYTKKIIKDNVNNVRIYLRDNNKYRLMFVRNYLYRDAEDTFCIEEPLYLINASLGLHYIDQESEVTYLIKYFEELYWCYCDAVYNISEFIEDVCQFFRDDMKAASIKMYEDIEKCFIEEE